MSTFRERISARLDDELAEARRVSGRASIVLGDATAAGVGTTIALVDAGRDAIVAETEDALDALIAAVVRDEAMRSVVKDAIRPDIVPWPTPWMRGTVEHGGRFNVTETAADDGEARKRAKNRDPLYALSALHADIGTITATDDVPVLDVETLSRMPGGRMLAAWIAIGTEEQRLEALRVTASLAGIELTQKRRDPSEHFEVPGAGWVSALALALVGRALVIESTRERTAHHAARIILQRADDEHAKTPETHRMLARAVEDALERAPTCADDVPPTEGVHPLDEALAALLEGIGENGKKLANDIRNSGKGPRERAERWRPYADPLRVPRLLAKALWADKVLPRMKRMANPVGAPGLVFPVLTNIAAASRRGAQQSLLSPQSAEILDRRGNRIGALRFTPQIDADLVNLTTLGNLPTARMVRFLLHRTWDQKWIEQIPAFNVVVVEGGFTALAALLGMRGKKAPEELQASATTLKALLIDSPSGFGGVFDFHNHKIGRQRRLELTATGPFSPDYASRTLGDHRGDVRDKQLVPVPLPQSLPPLVGRERDHGAQALQQLLVLREMRTRAVEMVETGTVEIGPRRWEELRDEASVPKAILPAVLDAYMTGDSEGRPAFLRSPSPGRYALADDYARERNAILQAGESMRAGAKGGRNAAASRRAGPPHPKKRRKARAD